MQKNYSFLLSHLLGLSFGVKNPDEGPHRVQTRESLNFVKTVGVGERRQEAGKAGYQEDFLRVQVRGHMCESCWRKGSVERDYKWDTL